jgi:hypothetical protein
MQISWTICRNPIRPFVNIVKAGQLRGTRKIAKAVKQSARMEDRYVIPS